MKSLEQHELASKVIVGSLSKMDKQCLSSIGSIHPDARVNYAINIWTGVVNRHEGLIAEKTEGEVVIKTARQRHLLAIYMFDKFNDGKGLFNG